ncbi:type IV pilin protein [Deinococcus sp.]|uniref:type IV pilin protein n=1 Tax=Deinococcus sp. TaxID=47478 RepID=UPI003B59DE88
MKRRSMGFTIMELLIVVSIIGVLSALLVPYMLGIRNKANVVSAAIVGRSVLTGLAIVEIDGDRGNCNYTNNVATITGGINREIVNAPYPIGNVGCSSSLSQWSTDVTYFSRGENVTTRYSAQK